MTVVLIAVIVLVLVFAIWFISVSNTSNTMKESNTSNTMKETYLFEYVNENEFKELERSLKTCYFLAYKKLCFEFYPALKEGNFLGKIVDFDKGKGKGNSTTTYELKLPTDSTFSKLHGDIKLHYTVYEREKIVMFDKLTPYDILMEVSEYGLKTYKDVVISWKNSDKDIFKINLLNK